MRAHSTRIAWTVNETDLDGNVVKTVNSTGSLTETVWGCCGKTAEVDRQGGAMEWIYDGLNRVQLQLKDMGTYTNFTEHGYDAAGRTLWTKVTGGSLSLVSSNGYDISGNLIWSRDQAGLITYHEYLDNGLTRRTIQPGGLTNETVSWPDGRTRYTRVNGVLQSTQDYGVEADGTQWTITHTGPGGTNSPMWSKTTTDLALATG